ncbi:FadR family transcriptional regulator [Rhodobacteraceae bacterium 2376]|uniref:FadR family transcriptional regulator n=1 Tax=Rhabdonatronobacter sediminivivens TaxID=2743469 RepID=A0A7Z0KZ98_9RHOB|nr:FCD domain-containing protein [Rhabdonatronobacter sediminivivens]NYS26482.1 FadR family transcriptional regulator [Rhabdonatronobacter sediminivivens]
MTDNSPPRRTDATLVQLRAWLSQKDFAEETKLPAERVLCEELGVTRGDLRKALAVLEREGVIWRHVGKGTFIGARPLDNMLSLTQIESETNPAEVMRARLLIEPILAREAARNATRQDMADIETLMHQARAASTWRQYEALDTALHRAIARAGANSLMLAIFDTVNTVRRSVVWGRLRSVPDRPPLDHHSFAEHDAIVDAIKMRDVEAAERAMFTHLQTVALKLDPTIAR